MSSTPVSSPWLVGKAAEDYSHKSRRFLAREVRQGRLRAARVGGRRELLFRAEWIDQWLIDQAAPVEVVVRRRA